MPSHSNATRKQVKERPHLVFAVDPRYGLFVRLADSAIPPIAALVDGLDFVDFPDEPGVAYLAIDDVIRWHRRELMHRERQVHRTAIEVFNIAKAKYAAGALDIERPTR